MARVSRKNKAEIALQSIERIYNVAIYTRLSVEDGGIDNPESIKLQEQLIRQFIDNQTDMCIYSTYSDNGFSGVNFERPQFEQMMQDIRERKVDCIVVKDLSRFGRNYVETGYFLEKIFPFLGVRFVAINDNYDTLTDNVSNDMVVSIKNIINSVYAKDLSKKVGTAFREKQEKGHYTTGSVPYGYSKDPSDKTRLVINPETAPIVKRMFQMRLEGKGYSAIAKVLNEEKILTPNMYNYLSGKHRKTPVPESMQIWKNVPIQKILENFNYTGNLEGHKRHRSLCDGIAERHTDKSERIITHNTHEAIVSLEDFEKVQEINKATSEKFKSQMGKYPKTENIFLGLMFCSDCGVKMTRSKNVSKAPYYVVRYTFICTTHKHSKYSDKPCTLKRVGEPELTELILQNIRINILLCTELVKKLSAMQKTKKYIGQQNRLLKNIDKLKRKVESITSRKTQLFERYADKTLSFAEYNKMKSEYESKCDLLEEEIRDLQLKEREQNEIFSAKNKWIQAFINREETDTLTREILVELIDKIVVSEYNTVTIHWKHSDELARLTEYLEVDGR